VSSRAPKVESVYRSAPMDDQNPLPTVKSGAVDTHCHLFLLEEPTAAVREAREAGVERMVCVGIDPDSSRRSLELAESHEGVFATAGMHPHEAASLDHEAGARIEEVLHSPLVVGVGETGLDHYRVRSPVEDQERAFRLHMDLSRESGKPLVVHVREAWPDILRLLEEGSVERVVLHCFSGDAVTARECARRGYFLSFAGNVTYPTSDRLREAAAATPGDRLLVETDAPYLSPRSRRGRDNAPRHVLETIEELARVRGESADEVRGSTAANARVAFPDLR
jgi:TatD DNase family protein